MEHHDHTHEGETHIHEHTHTDGSGTYTHSHEHTHDHSHSHGEGGGKTTAVLRYMLDHNIHHASELNDLAQQFTGEVRHQLLHAVDSFDQANGYLSAALELLKEEKSEH